MAWRRLRAFRSELMSALPQKEKEQLYGSMKKLELLAAEQLSHQEVRPMAPENSPGQMITITQ